MLVQILDLYLLDCDEWQIEPTFQGLSDFDAGHMLDQIVSDHVMTTTIHPNHKESERLTRLILTLISEGGIQARHEVLKGTRWSSHGYIEYKQTINKVIDNMIDYYNL